MKGKEKADVKSSQSTMLLLQSLNRLNSRGSLELQFGHLCHLQETTVKTVVLPFYNLCLWVFEGLHVLF